MIYCNNNLIIPKIDQLMKVTRLLCGGFVVTVLLNHVMSDGLGKVQFLNAVSQMAKGILSSSSPQLSPLPLWCREFFVARNAPLPSCFNFLHNEFDIAVTNNKNISQMSCNETVIRQSFLFGQKEINSIKDQLPLHMRTSSSFSKFRLITAFLWRCRTKVLNLNKDDEIVTLTFFLNLRGIRSKNFQEFKLADGYYGNAVVSTVAVTSGRKLCNNPLSYAVELMTEAMEKVTMNGDYYVKSYLDFMAFYGKPGFVKNKGAWIVSDSSRIGFHEVDFGWGKPVYGGPMDGSAYFYNSVYSRAPRNNNGREIGVLAPICLPVSAMDKLKEEVKKLSVSKQPTSML